MNPTVPTEIYNSESAEEELFVLFVDQFTF